MDWYDKAMEQCEKDYEEGFISAQEMREEMRNIHAELEEQAQEDYYSVMGNY